MWGCRGRCMPCSSEIPLTGQGPPTSRCSTGPVGEVVPEPVDDHPLADAAGRHAMSTMTAEELDLDLAPRLPPALDRQRARSADLPSPWLTANVRPAGSFGRGDVGRLRELL